MASQPSSANVEPIVLNVERMRLRIVAKHRARDNQRSKVYKSDRSLDDISKPLPSVEDIEAHVSEVFASEEVRKAFPSAKWRPPPEVMDGGGRKSAGANDRVVIMPRWARREGLLLHELAHTVVYREYGRHRDIEAHGWQFCAVYLQLVRFMMGREAQDILKMAMISNGVKFRPPRKKTADEPGAEGRGFD